MTYVEVNGVRVDRIVANQLPEIQKLVLTKNRDKHIIIDGRERSGKSKLARQLAKALDPDFNIEKIAFNSLQFIDMIKDKSRKKGDAIILDEAYGAANSRASMSDVNRAMVQLGTEMGQLNLFIIIVLPTFFDLDKYFAIWRGETLFHVYFDEDGGRGDYIELKRENIKVELKSHFQQEIPKEITDELFYYYWLTPEGRNEKVYWQIHLVGYADYKKDYYYISPKLLLDFDNKELF